MKLKLLSAAAAASLAAIMMMDAGAAQAQGKSGVCSFSERSSVWGGGCVNPRSDRSERAGFSSVRTDRPSNGVVTDPHDNDRGWDRDRKRGKHGKHGKRGHGHDHGKGYGKDRDHGKGYGKGRDRDHGWDRDRGKGKRYGKHRDHGKKYGRDRDRKGYGKGRGKRGKRD